MKWKKCFHWQKGTGFDTICKPLDLDFWWICHGIFDEIVKMNVEGCFLSFLLMMIMALTILNTEKSLSSRSTPGTNQSMKYTCIYIFCDWPDFTNYRKFVLDVFIVQFDWCFIRMHAQVQLLQSKKVLAAVTIEKTQLRSREV